MPLDASSVRTNDEEEEEADFINHRRGRSRLQWRVPVNLRSTTPTQVFYGPLITLCVP